MIARHVLIGSAASLALIASPITAQEADAAEEAVPLQEYSPEDDLNCALYTSSLLGVMGDDAIGTPQGAGVLAGLAYFLGRWEAARGGDLTEALSAQFPAFLELDGGELASSCGSRMQTFGGKMQIAGEALIALEEARAAKPPAQ